MADQPPWWDDPDRLLPAQGGLTEGQRMWRRDARAQERRERRAWNAGVAGEPIPDDLKSDGKVPEPIAQAWLHGVDTRIWVDREGRRLLREHQARRRARGDKARVADEKRVARQREIARNARRRHRAKVAVRFGNRLSRRRTRQIRRLWRLWRSFVNGEDIKWPLTDNKPRSTGSERSTTTSTARSPGTGPGAPRRSKGAGNSAARGKRSAGRSA